MALNSTECPRCFGPKEKGSHDCDACARLIAENGRPRAQTARSRHRSAGTGR